MQTTSSTAHAAGVGRSVGGSTPRTDAHTVPMTVGRSITLPQRVFMLKLISAAIGGAMRKIDSSATRAAGFQRT